MRSRLLTFTVLVLLYILGLEARDARRFEIALGNCEDCGIDAMGFDTGALDLELKQIRH